ncbi:MAG: ISL3 family transposase [Oscillospiraceae bacterium]|nr:ISL3 family transposase [Oscillospiraceae bacterium]
MASPLSILKTVLNLNHNRMHVTNCETATVTVHRFCETFEQTRIYVHARPYERVQKLCPVCEKKCPGYDTKYSTESSWRAPNLNGVPVYICYQPKRVKCPEHGVRTEYIPWADGGSRFTADFSNEIAWMVCRMSRTAVALFEDIDWRTVGNCVKAAHDRIEPDITARMHGLRRICVDETSYRKGFAYITVVYDMDRNRVVWVHEGNGLETFRLFCEALSLEEREKIEIVAGDGARWIDVCTKAYFPNATRCIDFFHVVEWANEKLDKVRTATAAKASREYDRRKQEFRKAEAEAAETAEAARQKRMAAEAELAAMPKRGRPSKRKQELLDFLASLTETATLDQQRIAAQAELEAMPKHGRPSRRKQELLAFLEGRLEFLPPRISPSKKNGRPRKEQFTSEHQEILDQLQNRAKAIKGSKHALGHNPENCSEYQADKIKLIENDYPDLYRAYQLKEALRLILHMKDEKQAAIELEQWITDASGSGLGPMVELSEKIGRHKANILNSVRCQANSAKSEAVNTTIKVLIKMARGFRNIGNMIALIYLKCSDLVIPLHNRPQMSSEKAAAARKTANELRKRRLSGPVPA